MAGPARCDSLYGYEQPGSATAHIRRELQSAEFFEEPDVAASLSLDFRHLNDALGTRSYHAIAIRPDESEWRYSLGCALPVARAATDMERSIVVTIAAITELCVRSNSPFT